MLQEKPLVLTQGVSGRGVSQTWSVKASGLVSRKSQKISLLFLPLLLPSPFPLRSSHGLRQLQKLAHRIG